MWATASLGSASNLPLRPAFRLLHCSSSSRCSHGPHPQGTGAGAGGRGPPGCRRPRRWPRQAPSSSSASVLRADADLRAHIQGLQQPGRGGPRCDAAGGDAAVCCRPLPGSSPLLSARGSCTRARTRARLHMHHIVMGDPPNSRTHTPYSPHSPTSPHPPPAPAQLPSPSGPSVAVHLCCAASPTAVSSPKAAPRPCPARPNAAASRPSATAASTASRAWCCAMLCSAALPCAAPCRAAPRRRRWPATLCQASADSRANANRQPLIAQLSPP